MKTDGPRIKLIGRAGAASSGAAPDADALRRALSAVGRGSALTLHRGERESRRPDDCDIVMLQSTYDRIVAHLSKDVSREHGGLLCGLELYPETGAPVVLITGAIPARHSDGTPVRLSMPEKTWDDFDRAMDLMDRQGFSLRRVGWYHSHPGLGIFLSSWDLDVCSVFNRPTHVALVVDPVEQRGGFFVRGSGGFRTDRPQGFWELHDQDRRSIVRWKDLRVDAAAPPPAAFLQRFEAELRQDGGRGDRRDGAPREQEPASARGGVLRIPRLGSGEPRVQVVTEGDERDEVDAPSGKAAPPPALAAPPSGSRGDTSSTPEPLCIEAREPLIEKVDPAVALDRPEAAPPASSRGLLLLGLMIVLSAAAQGYASFTTHRAIGALSELQKEQKSALEALERRLISPLGAAEKPPPSADVTKLDVSSQLPAGAGQGGGATTVTTASGAPAADPPPETSPADQKTQSKTGSPTTAAQPKDKGVSGGSGGALRARPSGGAPKTSPASNDRTLERPDGRDTKKNTPVDAKPSPSGNTGSGNAPIADAGKGASHEGPSQKTSAASARGGLKEAVGANAPAPSTTAGPAAPPPSALPAASPTATAKSPPPAGANKKP